MILLNQKEKKISKRLIPQEGSLDKKTYHTTIGPGQFINLEVIWPKACFDLWLTLFQDFYLWFGKESRYLNGVYNAQGLEIKSLKTFLEIPEDE